MAQKQNNIVLDQKKAEAPVKADNEKDADQVRDDHAKEAGKARPGHIKGRRKGRFIVCAGNEFELELSVVRASKIALSFVAYII